MLSVISVDPLDARGDPTRKHLTVNDVLPVHPDVAVSVRASLFVVEAEGVQQLVLHSAVVQAALTTQRHRLTAALTADV